jgi:hypothetical protein
MALEESLNRPASTSPWTNPLGQKRDAVAGRHDTPQDIRVLGCESITNLDFFDPAP